MKEGVGADVVRTIGTASMDALDPFLLFDEFFVASPAGFDYHPHAYFETVTFMIDGAFRHRDKHGNHGVIKSGGAQWMTATGVIHEEKPAAPGVNHGLQLWVNLKAKDKHVPPRYQDLEQVPVVEQDGIKAQVLAGTVFGFTSPTRLYTDALYAVFDLPAGKSVVQEINTKFNGFIYVLQGRVSLNDSTAKEYAKSTLVELLPSSSATSIKINNQSSSPALVALIAGEPTNEPLVRYGPFVANTSEELRQSVMDFRSGKFGSLDD